MESGFGVIRAAGKCPRNGPEWLSTEERRCQLKGVQLQLTGGRSSAWTVIST